MNTLRGLRQVFTPRRIHFGSCAARFARVLASLAPSASWCKNLFSVAVPLTCINYLPSDDHCVLLLTLRYQINVLKNKKLALKKQSMPFFFQPHIYFIFLRFWVFVGTVFPHCSHLSGLDFSKKCSFSAFLPQILSKKINWESVAMSRCGPTVFLIFAQGFGSLPACLTLFLVTPTFHVLYCPRSWPSYMFSCTWNKQCYAQ